MFLTMIYNTGLSGLECELPTWAQVQELEKMAMYYARQILGPERPRVTEEGPDRRRSTEQVRTMLRLTDMHTELRVRRLKRL